MIISLLDFTSNNDAQYDTSQAGKQYTWIEFCEALD